MEKTMDKIIALAISRGYEHICEDLRTLGCRIWQPGTEDLRIYERK